LKFQIGICRLYVAHYQALNKCVTHTPMPLLYIDSMVPMAVDIKILKIQLTGKFHNRLDICSNQRSVVRLSPMVLKHQTGRSYAWKVQLEQATKAQRGRRGIALLFNLGARWWWVVNNMPLPLSCRQRPGTHCIG
jgi:hypothetical protein